MRALIDADIVAYRASVAGQRSYNFGDTGGVVAIAEDPENAARAAVNMVNEWAEAAGCKDITVTFSGPSNFRRHILPSYKANRAGHAKPLAYLNSVAAIEAAFPFVRIDGLEADDVMGILATTDRYIDKAVVVTQDKDLRTIPGRHLNPFKERSPVLVTPADADFKWMLQTLMGDPTDGYSGAPGVGAKKALAALQPHRTAGIGALWGAVEGVFRGKGMGVEKALEQARVARILRREDYDKETKEVLLWAPTTTRVRISLNTVTASALRAPASTGPGVCG